MTARLAATSILPGLQCDQPFHHLRFQTRSAVNDQWSDDPPAVDDFLDLFEAVEVDLGVLGRVDAVSRADRRGEQIHAAPLDKLQRPGRIAQFGLGFRHTHLILSIVLMLL